MGISEGEVHFHSEKVSEMIQNKEKIRKETN